MHAWGLEVESVRDRNLLVCRLALAVAVVLGGARTSQAQSLRPVQVPPPPPRPRVAPEIDPASATAALALLAGGVMMIRGRRRS